MKKIFLSALILLITSTSFCQTSEIAVDSLVTVKSPNAFAFQEVNFFEMNEYTGKADVQIPIWEINLGDISIPISISYNTGGVKVNSVASDVGLNWSLNAGGVVTKEIKGESDFMIKRSRPTAICGFLMDNEFDWITRSVDGKPDIYTATAPGITTVFTHKKGRTPFEITKKGSAITTNVVNENAPFETGGFPSSRIYKDIKDISIVSNSGYKYDFFVRDSIWVDRYRIPETWQGTTHQDLVQGLGIGGCLMYGGADEDPDTPDDAASNSDCYGQGYYNSYYLSKLTDQSTGNHVTFSYEKYFVDDYEMRISNENVDGYIPPGTDMERYRRYRNEVDSWFNRIKSINYKNININFIYSTANRNDIPGNTAKSLTAIEIRDNHGKVIKRANFVYDYTQSVENCTAPECYRLRLKEMFFSYSNGEKDPSYVFTYNTTKLPKRFSYKKDFFGFYNAANSTDQKLIPKLYYYPNNGKHSVLPFQLGSSYYSPPSTFSMAPNFTYAKAQSLSQVRFPTGGTLELNYEPHSFLIDGYQKQGGGLRVYNQTFKDVNGNTEKEINYTYSNNGITTGSIVSAPKYSDIKIAAIHNSPNVHDPHSITIQNAVDKVVFTTSFDSYSLNGVTSNSFVGYNQVVVSQTGNGYRELKFSSPKEIGNDFPTQFNYGNVDDYGSVPGTEKLKWLEFKVLNGMFCNIYTDNDIRRGNLLEEKVYDENDILKKRKAFNYTYDQFENESISVWDREYFYRKQRERNWYEQTYVSTTLTIHPYRNLLTSTVEETYLENGTIINTENFIYDTNLPFIKETHTTIGADSYVIKNYYPFDSEVSGNSNISNLVAQNRLADVIRKESFKNNSLINTTLYNYGNFDGNYLMNKMFSGKAQNNLTQEFEIDSRDSDGNITQYHTPEGLYHSAIWGYNKSYPIARIINGKISDINTPLLNNLLYLSNEDDDATTSFSGKEGALRQQLNNLRDVLPNAQIATYTYNPLIGMTSMTEASGNSQYYKYDGHNRLSQNLDENLNIETQMNYNYKIQNNNVIITNPPISSVDIVHNYDQANRINYFTANVQGGIGPFSYSWNYRINGQVTVVESNSNRIELSLPFGEDVVINVQVSDPSSSSSDSYNIIFPGCQSYTVRSAPLGRGEYDTIRYINCVDGSTSSLYSTSSVNICVLAGTEITGSVTPVSNGNCN